VSEPSQTKARLAAGFIFVTVVLDVMGGMMLTPVLPSLIHDISPGDPAHTARWFGAITTVFFVMQFFSGPVLGALSDRFGRRPIILTGVFGFGLDYVIMALAPSLWWLFAARAVSGAFAGNMTAAGAYIADTTPPENRARMFALFYAAIGFGGAIGPALGGLLAAHSIRAPFWVAAALALVNGLYGIFVLPESLDAKHRAPFHWRNANPVGAPRALIRTQPALLVWGLVIALFSLGGVGVNSVLVVYTAYRYAWAPRDIGLLLSFCGVFSIFVQTLLVGPLVKRIGDRGTMFLGLALSGIGCVMGGLSPTSLGFWVATVVVVAGNIAGPAQSAIMSRLVGPSEQGLLSGTATSIRSINGMIAPILFTSVFAFCVADGGVVFSGIANAFAGLLFVASAALAAYATRDKAAAVADQTPAQ
jgi:DHA1 family tetracycline resistance protein-like MFS transporter